MKKRFLTVILILTILSSAIMTPAVVQADTTLSEALDLYADKLTEFMKTDKTYKQCGFSLAYIDEDNIPELLICGPSFFSSSVDFFFVSGSSLKSGTIDAVYGSVLFASKKNILYYDISRTGISSQFFYRWTGDSMELTASFCAYIDIDFDIIERTTINDEDVDANYYTEQLDSLLSGYTWTRSENFEISSSTISDMKQNPKNYIVGWEDSADDTAENVYAKAETDLTFASDSLEDVTDSEGAVDLLKTTLRGLSGEEIASVSAKDQLAYLAEETAARSATVQVEDADIVIDDESAEAALGTVSEVVGSAESILKDTGVSVRSVRSKVRYSTSKENSVSISKENLSADVDVVEAVTPFGSFEFEPDSVSELTVDSEGKNSISVSFDKNDTTSKVTVKFPDITSDGYKAVVDEEGNVVGGKYNPVTDELSAKIDESGVFTVVTNEKDFADIKSQPEEIQNAIKKLASKGIIKGTSETEFSPDTPITRAEIAALVVRILGVDDPNADGGFSDVTKENWYFGSAGSAKRENIIKGYEDNTFRGTVVIPKVQITSITARVLTNRLGYFGADENLLNEFTDADAIADWARGEVALAAYANMVIRRTDGSFAPDMEMTRGDAAVILEKLFDKVW